MRTIDPEVQKIIKLSIDQAVKKTTEAILAASEKVDAEQRNYFQETERLLYSLPALKLSLAEYDEDIANNSLMAKREKSKDIVHYSTTGGGSTIDEDEIVKSKLASVERTRKQVQRIERALETVKDYQYYDIIPLKYWDGLTGEEIAARLNCDERTYRRHKNRLINKLKVVLFGADAL